MGAPREASFRVPEELPEPIVAGYVAMLALWELDREEVSLPPELEDAVRRYCGGRVSELDGWRQTVDTPLRQLASLSSSNRRERKPR